MKRPSHAPTPDYSSERAPEKAYRFCGCDESCALRSLLWRVIPLMDSSWPAELVRDLHEETAGLDQVDSSR